MSSGSSRYDKNETNLGTYTWNRMAIRGMMISQTSRRRSDWFLREGLVSSRSVYSLIDCRTGDGWAALHRREVSRACRSWEPVVGRRPDRHPSDRSLESGPWGAVLLWAEWQRTLPVALSLWPGRPLRQTPVWAALPSGRGSVGSVASFLLGCERERLRAWRLGCPGSS